MITELDTLPADLRPSDRVIKLKPHQDGFIFSDKRFPAMISGWGTGKSMSVIERARLDCERYRNNLGLIVRKEFTNLRDSTIPDFEKYLGCKVKTEPSDYMFPSTNSKIMFRHADQLTKQNIDDMNLGFFVIMQAGEFDSDEVFTMLRGRIRRDGVPHWGAVVDNTRGHNWIYRLWKLNDVKDKDFDLYEAKSLEMRDILPKDTLDDWDKMRLTNPEIYKRFVENSWDVGDDQFVVIRSQDIEQAVNFEMSLKPPFKKLVTVCDVAGESEGADETVIYNFENWKIKDQEIYKHRDLMDTCGRIQYHAQRNGSNMICVDKVGLGGGVYSRLTEIFSDSSRMEVYGFDGRVSAPMGIDEQTYSNYKTYAWFKASEDFRDCKVSIPDDGVLKRQLMGVKYKYISDRKISLFRKDDIKKTLGESPDRADALVMGLDAVRRAKPVDGKELTEVRSIGWTAPKYRVGYQRQYQYV